MGVRADHRASQQARRALWLLAMDLRLLLVPAILALSSCGGAEPAQPGDAAQEYAARINGGRTSEPVQDATGANAAQSPASAPALVPPRADGTPAAYPPGYTPGPVTVSCMADQMGPFLGRQADEQTRLAVMAAARGASDVRFVDAGSGFLASDPANPRLNIMLDNRGIIRDAKCG